MRIEEWPAPSMDTMLDRARRLQIESFGGDPSLLEPPAKVVFVRNMVLGLMVEAVEALNEMKGWKWWKSAAGVLPGFSREKYLEELVDIAQFTAALAVAVDCTDEEWREAYHRKYEINQERMAE